jgi:hypothetical protein
MPVLQSACLLLQSRRCDAGIAGRGNELSAIPQSVEPDNAFAPLLVDGVSLDEAVFCSTIGIRASLMVSPVGYR